MTRCYAMNHTEGFANSRRFALAAPRQTARTHPVGPRVIVPQAESDNPNEKQRRRIAVAVSNGVILPVQAKKDLQCGQCSRCRKRKIKCSGDPKNGMGCQNCRNAGAEPGNCQFLRVGQTEAYMSNRSDIFRSLLVSWSGANGRIRGLL